MTARDHNRLLSIFFFIKGGIALIAAVSIALIYGGVGTVMLGTSSRGEEQMVGGIFILASVGIGLLILAFAALYLAAGYYLLKERPTGRTLGIVASCLALFNMPLGTALGVYGLWFFFGEVGKSFYDGLTRGGAVGSPQQPPPNSWQ